MSKKLYFSIGNNNREKNIKNRPKSLRKKYFIKKNKKINFNHLEKKKFFYVNEYFFKLVYL